MHGRGNFANSCFRLNLPRRDKRDLVQYLPVGGEGWTCPSPRRTESYFVILSK
jgi:hypothetical protein